MSRIGKSGKRSSSLRDLGVYCGFYISLVVCTLIMACGLATPKYEDYGSEQPRGTNGGGTDSGDTEAGSTNGGTTADCDTKAALSFKSEIQPAIDSRCQSCHANQAALPLISNGPVKNREKLLSYIGSNVDGFKTLVKGQGHGGGDVSADLSSQSIDTWFAKEQECKGPASAGEGTPIVD